MKKIISAVLIFALALLVLPQPIPASASTASAIIDMHGDKTYLGTSSDWGKRWNSDNFEDVTGEDVRYGGSITVKAGKVDDISVSGENSTLVVQGGKMDDIYSNGKLVIKRGDIRSAEARSDITINGVDIRRDVISDEGDVSLSSTVTVGGEVKGRNISLNSGAVIKVSGTITGTKKIYLSQCSLRTKGFRGDNTGSLEVKSYDSYLPPIEDMQNITADSNKVMVNNKITAESLYISDRAQFITSSWLELDTLQGPGTLCFNSGKLTIHCEVSDNPLLVFNNAVSSGTIAFKADEGAVSEDEVKLYSYGLEKDYNGGYDEFRLKKVVADGLLLDKSRLSVSSKNPGTVKAVTKPDLSKFAEGTKIKWELFGDTSAFSISQSSVSNTSCNVTLSASTTGTHRATLTAYLVDRKGDRLSDYKSDSCIIETGYANDTVNTFDSNLKLDTDSVSILSGNTYWVLATTNSASIPHAMSYNSAVAEVGQAKPARDRNGNPGWLYPVTGISKGKVTIDIAGQKMLTKVSTGILMDTASYTMSPGGKYCIGVQVKGLDPNYLSVYSINNCTDVQLIKKGNDGKNIYRVTGMQPGLGYIVFAITGGQTVMAEINVQNGATAGGKSARMVALAQ